MKLPIYQVDAFAHQPFNGNPAAICPLDTWLDTALMQSIAEENNLSETAFTIPTEAGYHIRWFTPLCEVDLCGHATLAAAHVITQHLGDNRHSIIFSSRSGELRVNTNGSQLTLNFPALDYSEIEPPQSLSLGLGKIPISTYAGDDYIAIFEREQDIVDLTPDVSILGRLDRRGVIATAPGNDVDFVSRFFAPKAGISEDPVTGSAHCLLTPYWAHRLAKTKLTARQLSSRGGRLDCQLAEDRVLITGSAHTYLIGEIEIPGPSQ